MFTKRTTLLFLVGLFLGCQPATQPPQQPPPSASTKTASEHLDAGLQFVQQGQHEKALAEFTAAIVLQPSAHAYSNRGLIYSGLGEHEKSLADHNKAVELAPKDSTNYYNRSLHYVATGESDKALSDLNESIRLEPTFHAALTARGEIWQEKGEYEKAFTDFRQAILFAPDHFLAHNDIAWLLAACPDDNLRNGKQALIKAKQACELSGWRWETVDTLAASWAELNEFENAANAQERAIMAAPEEQHPEMKVRLELYKQNKSYRLGNEKTEKTSSLPRSTGLLSDLNTDAVAVLNSIPGTQLDVVRSGPDSKPSHRIIHIADFHFVEKTKYAADLRDLSDDPLTDDEIDRQYQEFLGTVEAVQGDQTVLLKYLIEKHGLTKVHVEGLSKDNQPIFDKQIAAVRNLYKQLKELRTQAEELEADPNEPAKLILAEVTKLQNQLSRDSLQIGIAGRLLIFGELERLLPLEDEAAFRAANPVGKDGKIDFDKEKNEAREDAQAQLLLDAGPFSVIVLGLAHDLSDNVDRLSDGKAEYIRVEGVFLKEVVGDMK